jgi:hypothetical protein
MSIVLSFVGTLVSNVSDVSDVSDGTLVSNVSDVSDGTLVTVMPIRASELSRRGLVGSFVGELKRVLPYGRMQMVVKNSGWDRDYRKAEVGYVSLPDHH